MRAAQQLLKLGVKGVAGASMSSLVATAGVGLVGLVGSAVTLFLASGKSEVDRSDFEAEMLKQAAAAREGALEEKTPADGDIMAWTASLPPTLTISELNELASAATGLSSSNGTFRGLDEVSASAFPGSALHDREFVPLEIESGAEVKESDGANVRVTSRWNGGADTPEILSVEQLEDDAALLLEETRSDLFDQSPSDSRLGALNTVRMRDLLTSMARNLLSYSRSAAGVVESLVTGPTIVQRSAANALRTIEFLQRTARYLDRTAVTELVRRNAREVLQTVAPLAVIANIIVTNTRSGPDGSDNAPLPQATTGGSGYTVAPNAAARAPLGATVSSESRDAPLTFGGMERFIAALLDRPPATIIVNVGVRRSRTEMSTCDEEFCTCGGCYSDPVVRADYGNVRPPRRGDNVRANKKAHAGNGNTDPMADRADLVTLSSYDYPAAFTDPSASLVVDSTLIPGPAMVYDGKHVPTVSTVGQTIFTPYMYDDSKNSASLAPAGMDEIGLCVQPRLTNDLVAADLAPYTDEITRVLATKSDNTGVLRASGENVNGATTADLVKLTATPYLSKMRPCSADVGMRALLYANNRAQFNPSPGTRCSAQYPMPANDDAVVYAGAPFSMYNKTTVSNADSVRMRWCTLAQYAKLRAGSLAFDFVNPDGSSQEFKGAVTDTVYLPVMSTWSADDLNLNCMWLLCHLAYPYKAGSWACELRNKFNAFVGTGAYATNVAGLVRVPGPCPGYYADGTEAAAVRALRVVFVLADRADLPANRTQETGSITPIRFFTTGAGPGAQHALNGTNGVHGRDYAAGDALASFSPSLRVASVCAAEAYRRWCMIASMTETRAVNVLMAELSHLYSTPPTSEEAVDVPPVVDLGYVLGRGGPLGGEMYVSDRQYAAPGNTIRHMQMSTSTASCLFLTMRTEVAQAWTWTPSYYLGVSDPLFYIASAGKLFVVNEPASSAVDVRAMGSANRLNSMRLLAATDAIAQRQLVTLGGLTGCEALGTPMRAAVRGFTRRMGQLWSRLTDGLVVPAWPLAELSGATEARTALAGIARADIVCHTLAGTALDWGRRFAWASENKADTGGNYDVHIAVSAFMTAADAKSGALYATVLLNSTLGSLTTAWAAAPGRWGVRNYGGDSFGLRFAYPGFFAEFQASYSLTQTGKPLHIEAGAAPAPIVYITPWRDYTGSTFAASQLVTTDVQALRNGADNTSQRYAVSGKPYDPTNNVMADDGLAYVFNWGTGNAVPGASTRVVRSAATPDLATLPPQSRA